MQADKGRERFNKMDSDGNGYISKKEAKEAKVAALIELATQMEIDAFEARLADELAIKK